MHDFLSRLRERIVAIRQIAETHNCRVVYQIGAPANTEELELVAVYSGVSLSPSHSAFLKQVNGFQISLREGVTPDEFTPSDLYTFQSYSTSSIIEETKLFRNMVDYWGVDEVDYNPLIPSRFMSIATVDPLHGWIVTFNEAANDSQRYPIFEMVEDDLEWLERGKPLSDVISLDFESFVFDALDWMTQHERGFSYWIELSKTANLLNETD